jgi:hypothetical protein
LALGDYILCCKCDVKLIYDGDRGNREWWQERFGEEPAILCPKCDKREWVGLTDDEVYKIAFALEGEHWRKIADAIEAKLKEKNT